MINKAIKGDILMKMPPTKESLNRLFLKLNLYVPSYKVLDCLVHSRGTRMEEAPPEEFQMKRLVQWFELNLRSLKHLDERKVEDEGWLRASRRRKELGR